MYAYRALTYAENGELVEGSLWKRVTGFVNPEPASPARVAQRRQVEYARDGDRFCAAASTACGLR
jgi:hypothetical protein